MAAPLPKITWTGGAGGTWTAIDPVLDDTGDLPVYERAAAWALSGRAKGLHFATRYRREVRLGFLPEWKVFKALEGAHANEAIERLFDDGWASFAYYPDAAGASGGTYMLDDETRKALKRARLSPGNPTYSLTLGMLKIA
jgi:hypothetical protein